MADFEGIAKQFVEYYYQTFDRNREELAPLYRDESMLTFEAAPTQGTASIIEKLKGLPFQQVEHQVDSLDAQPANPNGGILVVVSGKLLVDAEKRPMSYMQTFQLLPNNEGSYFIFNDVFRLIYAASG